MLKVVTYLLFCRNAQLGWVCHDHLDTRQCTVGKTWILFRTRRITITFFYTSISPSQSFPQDGETSWGILMKLGVKERKDSQGHPLILKNFWSFRFFSQIHQGGYFLPSSCLISMFSTNNLLSITVEWRRQKRPKRNSPTSLPLYCRTEIKASFYTKL